jgi:hypothetical protein
MADTVDIVKLARKQLQAMVLFNAVPTRGPILAEIEEFAKGYGIELAPVRIADRAPLSHALIGGMASPSSSRKARRPAKFARSARSWPSVWNYRCGEREMAKRSALKLDLDKEGGKAAPVLERETGQAGGNYVAPSRVGKITFAIHVDPAVRMQVKRLALQQDTTVHALMEEAQSDVREVGREADRLGRRARSSLRRRTAARMAIHTTGALISSRRITRAG